MLQGKPNRYFRKWSFFSWPMPKVLLCGALGLVLLFGTVAGAVAYSGGQSQPAAAPQPDPTATPAPVLLLQSTPAPAEEPVVVQLEVSVIQQDIGVDLFRVDYLPGSRNAVEKTPLLGEEFRVLITDPDNDTKEYFIDPETGTLLVEDVKPGDYLVALDQREGWWIPESRTVTVKEKVVYTATKEEIKEVVEEKVVQSTEIVESQDDNAFGSGGSAPIVEELTDTVRFAESASTTQTIGTVTKAEVNGEGFMLLENGSWVPYKPIYNEQGDLTGAQRYALPQSLSAEGAAYGNGFSLMLLAEGDEQPANEEPSASQEPDPSEEPPAGEEPSPSEEPPADTQPPAEQPSPSPTPTPTPTPEWAGWPDTLSLDQLRERHFKLSTKELTETRYTGWQTLGGNTYYYDPDSHKAVTGVQVIRGVVYTFSSEGVLAAQRRGIDVSKFQSNIDWNAVKAAGIDFAIIRVGFRGYGSGKLVEDSMFKANMRGAAAAGIPVGVYFYSQAINEEEAREEALMAIGLCQGYRISYPIYFDTEKVAGDTGRADGISAAQRTACAVAFCETVRSAGYTAGVYSYRDWFYYSLNFSNISKYNIWIAQYRSKLDFRYNYKMWQYTSTGRVPGISTDVDMNIWY